MGITRRSFIFDEDDGKIDLEFEWTGGGATHSLATRNVTAELGSDFLAVPRTITTAPGSKTLKLTVNLVNDAIREPNETFIVRNFDNEPGDQLDGYEYTITIRDNDTGILRQDQRVVGPAKGVEKGILDNAWAKILDETQKAAFMSKDFSVRLDGLPKSGDIVGYKALDKYITYFDDRADGIKDALNFKIFGLKGATAIPIISDTIAVIDEVQRTLRDPSANATDAAIAGGTKLAIALASGAAGKIIGTGVATVAVSGASMVGAPLLIGVGIGLIVGGAIEAVAEGVSTALAERAGLLTPKVNGPASLALDDIDDGSFTPIVVPDFVIGKAPPDFAWEYNPISHEFRWLKPLDPNVEREIATRFGLPVDDPINLLMRGDEDTDSDSDLLFGGAGNDKAFGGRDVDIIFGQTGEDHLFGGDSIDVIDGGLGSDQLSGDAGDDGLAGGGGPDRLFGGDGEDSLEGGGGRDRLVGGDADDDISGGGSHDAIYGGEGDDEAAGGDGRDLIVGGAGSNMLFGGLGDDSLNSSLGKTFAWAPGLAERDEVYGGDGGDEIIFSDYFDKVDGGSEDDLLIYTATEGLDTYYSNFGSNGGTYGIFGGAGVDVLSFAQAERRIVISTSIDGAAEAISGVERIVMSRFSDYVSFLSDVEDLESIQMGRGDDSFSAWERDVTCYGGDGADRLVGGDGRDILYGGSGNDTMRFGDKGDLLYGGFGVDDLWSFGATAYGGDGDDRMSCSSGRSFGGQDNDKIYVSLDSPLGSATVYGGAGDDLLETYGAGAGALSGGSGADLFLFQSLDPASGPCDEVVDFVRDESDRIDISIVDANELLDGDQAFIYVGRSKFSGRASEMARDGDDLIFDVNGDAVSDYRLTVIDMDVSERSFIL